jgi:hypothetical protein
MNALTLTFRLPYPPECPLCRRPLSPNAVEVVDGVLFCSECRYHAESLALSVEVDVCRCCSVAAGWHHACGLYVWAPGDLAERSCTAAQWLVSNGFCTAPIAEYVRRWAGQVRDAWGSAIDLDVDDAPRVPITRTTPSCLHTSQKALFDVAPPRSSRDVHAN